MSFYFTSEKNQRESNEDSFCQMELRMNHEAVIQIMTVADGMGGLSDGKFFSNRAMNLWYSNLMQLVLSDSFRDCSLSQQMRSLQEFSVSVFERINQELYLEGLDRGRKGGTTLTTAIHFWDKWIISNLGDSPVYVMKEGKVTPVCMIHNRAYQMVREGVTEKGSEEFYRNKNRLMEYLGRRSPVHPYTSMISDQDVDYLLMGSDGAFGDYDESNLAALFEEVTTPPSQIIATMFENGRAGGERDNQTAILYVNETSFEKKQKKSEEWEQYEEEGSYSSDAKSCSYTVIERETVGNKIRNRLLGKRR